MSSDAHAHAGGDHGAVLAGDAAHGEHEHGEALGPIDWRAWGAGGLGVLIGLVIALSFYVVTRPV